MTLDTRRTFNKRLLGSLVTFGLIETLIDHDLLAESIKPITQKWFQELADLARDLKGQKLADVDFQSQLEALYRRVDVTDLVKAIDLDRLVKNVAYPAKGAASLGFDLGGVAGLPKKPLFGKQVFALKKGRSIVPHGHDNMCTGFIVLRGDFQGRHYDRVEDNKDHYLIKPTIDRSFKPGECSTVSDHKDNVHWFVAKSEPAFIFNIHVVGYNPQNPKVGSRVYVDPEGEKVNGGLIVAKKMSSRECHRKYG